jgi:hypothetical protein
MTPPRQFPDQCPMPPAAQRRACQLRAECGLLVREITLLVSHEFGHPWDRSYVARVLRAHGLGISVYISPAIMARWREAGAMVFSKEQARSQADAQLARCAAAEAAHVPVYRCECGGRRSTPPDGVCVHGQRTREGVAA